MESEFGAKFSRRFDAESKQATANNVKFAMMDWDEKLSGIPVELISYGFKRLEREVMTNKRNNKESWPPTSTEFKEMCRPCHVDLKLPSVNEAFKAAKNKNFHHSAIVNQVYLLISREDWKKTDSYLWPKFNAEYKKLLIAKATGNHIQWPEKQLLISRDKPDPKELEKNFSKWRDILNKKCEPGHSNLQK